MSTVKVFDGQGSRLPHWPLESLARDLAVAIAMTGVSVCGAQPRPSVMDDTMLQQEADYRVVAARCGTPAFEKQFYIQSRQFVAASNGQDKEAIARQERAIERLRRNPLSLIGSQSDCKVQGEELKRVMDERSRSRSSQQSRTR